MLSLANLIEWVYLILLVLVIVGSRVAEISVYIVIIIKAMTITKGIYIQTCLTAKNICSSLSAAVDSWAAKKPAPVCTIESPLPPISELKAISATPRCRRVQFCNDVRVRMYTPSAPPNGCTRAQAVLESRNNKSVTETKTSLPTRPALRPTQDPNKPPIRRVGFSELVRVREYNPRAPPEHTRSSGLGAGLAST
ncbi:hypothetical protein FRC03_005226 [Tulasnella sp. 419]|nr:hypothetical protein FRC03_005226 [Tulasnella sp. 419]